MPFPTEVLVYGSAFMALVSFFKVLWLIYFILYHETIKQGKAITFKGIFTPFSSLLLLMITSNVGLYLTEAVVFYLEEDSTSELVCRTFQNLFTGITEGTYVYYSSLRAQPIFDQVFPKAGKTAAAGARISPLLFFIQWLLYPISQALKVEDGHKSPLLVKSVYYMSILNGALIILFDVFCLVTFTLYLRSTQIHDGVTDERFLIISRHGITAVAFGLSALAFYVLFSLATTDDYLVVVYLHFSALYFILFRMKMMLHRDKLNKEKERRSKIEYAALCVDSRGLSRQNSLVSNSMGSDWHGQSQGQSLSIGVNANGLRGQSSSKISSQIQMNSKSRHY
ncbi:hypothetical protein BDR26DRAFT_867380 [Obelidium mucronatum]|nr:hypothetical protein BDR26DRAFT_879019 [Obelidium mucronatum]KAI9334137.1 hypothetical protein BDR26DRAFT_867380 [Obelidium mucronatum]